MAPSWCACERLCPGKPDQHGFTPSTYIFLHSPIFYLCLSQCKWCSRESWPLRQGTPREERGEGQIAGCVDTQSRRTPILQCSTLVLWINIQVLIKMASLVSAARQRLQKSHLTPLVLPCISPGCSTNGGGAEGNSRWWQRKGLGWSHCNSSSRSTCWRVLRNYASQKHHCVSFKTGSCAAW